jgi:hypothetical protein
MKKLIMSLLLTFTFTGVAFSQSETDIQCYPAVSTYTAISKNKDDFNVDYVIDREHSEDNYRLIASLLIENYGNPEAFKDATSIMVFSGSTSQTSKYKVVLINKDQCAVAFKFIDDTVYKTIDEFFTSKGV